MGGLSKKKEREDELVKVEGISDSSSGGACSPAKLQMATVERKEKASKETEVFDGY